MTAFEVHEGKDKDAAIKRGVYRTMALKSGLATETIYLSGGSQTRRDVRDDYHAFARENNIRCESNAWSVTLGGTDR